MISIFHFDIKWVDDDDESFVQIECAVYGKYRNNITTAFILLHARSLMIIILLSIEIIKVNIWNDDYTTETHIYNIKCKSIINSLAIRI